MSFGKTMRLLTSLAPLTAVLVPAACSEDPTSSGSGAPFAIVSSRATTSQVVGVQFQVVAQAVDRNRTPLPRPVDVTPSSANALRVDSVRYLRELQESRVYVTPLAFDTAAYLVMNAAGISDTVYVSALPGSVVASTPSDSLGSGESMNITVRGVSGTGADLGVVPFQIVSISNTALLSVEGGVVTGKGPGTAQIVIGGPGGLLRDTISVRVVPGVFSGTVTAGAVDAGKPLTITAAAGQEFDSDTQVRFSGNDEVFVISRNASEMVVIVPFGVTNNRFTMSNVGPNQLAFAGTFTLGSTTDPNEPNDNPATAPEATLGTPIYGMVSESDADDFFTLTVAAAGTYTVKLEWPDAADLDIYVTNANVTLNACSDDFIGCAGATSANPETGVTSTLAPGTYRIYVNLWTASGPTTQYRLTVTRN